ncbi:MAG: HEPN domain-containing protein [Candidatus Eisenbacteria bacterium]|nr:HEPN domain-containing protein [Candidatus Eisenbacteria bacterium]
MDPFEDCLKKGRLKAIEPDLEDIKKELRTAEDELTRARTCFAEKRNEDCLVQSYFAMFRSAKSLLRRKGYRDTNMYSLLAGLRKLYVEPKDLEGHLLDVLSVAKEQKDLVYEGARCSLQDTRAVLRNSEVFCNRVREIMALPEFPPLAPMEEEEPQEQPTPEQQQRRYSPRERFRQQPRRGDGGGRGTREQRWSWREETPGRRPSGTPDAFRPRQTRPKKRD